LRRRYPRAFRAADRSIATARRWLPLPALAAVAIVSALLLAGRTPPPLIADLVGTSAAPSS